MNYTNEQKMAYKSYKEKRFNLNQRLGRAKRGIEITMRPNTRFGKFDFEHTKAGKCFLGGVGTFFNKHQQKFGV